jgi:hypothetical protein
MNVCRLSIANLLFIGLQEEQYMFCLFCSKLERRSTLECVKCLRAYANNRVSSHHRASCWVITFASASVFCKLSQQAGKSHDSMHVTSAISYISQCFAVKSQWISNWNCIYMLMPINTNIMQCGWYLMEI